MTSSMLSGDRKWGSSRRSAMTVLGKVPKPINLPSQRLENRGLDPTVEIVPKGTLSWGNKSSSASNAWGTSSVSPNTGGGTTSPSYLSGHISSESGTRPSTAGSDKSHEPSSSVWGPNSRPSSASGLLTSNQTSLASLRPHSAEPRPGSSQLSRFAEHSEHQVAWSAPGTAAKLGGTSSKNEGFSLTSGDFPTLGSENNSTGKNAELGDHSSYSRPSSSSGDGVTKETIGTAVVGDISANASAKSWKRESPSYIEEGRPGMEKWQGNHQPYPVAGIPPQHYDAWHGGPVHPQGGPVLNPQGGVWFRGPPGGPPFGAQVPPGGFPMEPFPYYSPQAGAHGNPQPVPPAGGGPRGHHLKNREMYRPHMPEAYMQPGMPIRPGFYPGPVPFEGYYGSPMGYYNSNERDVQFMGRPGGPPVYNRYPSQSAPESTNQKGLSEKLESAPHDTRGPYKILKQHDGWDRRNEEQRTEGAVTTNVSCIENKDKPRVLSSENDWRLDRRKEGERERWSERPTSRSSDRGASSAHAKVPESLGTTVADTIQVKKIEIEACNTQDNTQTLSAKGSSLIQKIEGLNAKARVSDVSREDQRKTHEINPKSDSSLNESGSGSGTEILNSDKARSKISVSRRPAHGVLGKPDIRGRGKFTNEEGDGWGKRSLVSEPTSLVSTAGVKVHVDEHATSMEAIDKSDPNDAEAQRAKMRELAKQRMKQLQEEEEERTRRQMAKARAKLEELNRRSQVAEGSNQKSENSSSGDVQIRNKPQTSVEPLADVRKYDSQVPASGSNFSSVTQTSESTSIRKNDLQVPSSGSDLNTVAQNSESTSVKVEKSLELPLERPKSAYKELVFMHDKPVSLQPQVTVTAPQAHDSGISRKTQTPNQKQNTQLEKKFTGKNTSTSMTATSASQTDALVNVSSSGGIGATSTALGMDSSLATDSGVISRKRSNRNGKNKHKAENSGFVAAAIPPSMSNDTDLTNTNTESGKLNASKGDLDLSTVQLRSRDAHQSKEQNLSLPNEESQGKSSGHGKPQHSRRMPRNPQAARHSENVVVWAPVRSQNKTEATDDTNPKTEAAEGVGALKNDHQVQTRNKRAEMERYVPKHVAKEMAHQGSTQSGVSVVHETTVNENKTGVDFGPHDPENSQSSAAAVGKTGLAMDSRNVSNKPNKQGKTHGAWRQRGSAEPTNIHGFPDLPSYTSNVGQSDLGSVTEQPQNSSEWNDGWNMPEEPSTVVPVSASFVVKEQRMPGRRKQHSFKGQKTVPDNQNHEQQKSYGGDADRIYRKSPTSEISRPDMPSASKENQAAGEHAMPHWQPKPQTYAANNHRVNRTNGPQGAADQLSSTPKEDTTDNVAQHQHDQYKSERYHAGEGQNRRERKTTNRGCPSSPHHGPVCPVELAPYSMDARQEHQLQTGFRRSGNQNNRFSRGQESRGDGNYSGHDARQQKTPAKQNRRERKTTNRGCPSSPHHGPVCPVELAPSSMDARQEHQLQTGFRRSGNQNNRFSRGQESRGDGNYSGHDARQQKTPANRDRQRQGGHLEYQPVGPYNSNEKYNNPEGQEKVIGT